MNGGASVLKQPKQRADKLLNWAFVMALSLHAMALAGAACLPTHVGRQDLTDIRVFDMGATEQITPVELVELGDRDSIFENPAFCGI